MSLHSNKDPSTDQQVGPEHLQMAQRALVEAETIDQLKRVREMAETMRKAAHTNGVGLDLYNRFVEVKLQAERRIGCRLIQMKQAADDTIDGTGFRLRDLGVDKNQSARWQLAATVPETAFRNFVEQSQRNNTELSAAALLRLARELKSEQARASLQIDWKATSYLKTRAVATRLRDNQECATLRNLLLEVRNHTHVLKNLFERLCLRAGLEADGFEVRAAAHYLGSVDMDLATAEACLRKLARRTDRRPVAVHADHYDGPI